MDIKVSKDTHISRWVDWENLIYFRQNSTKKLLIKTKTVIECRKKSKMLSQVKPVENISKNLQSFLEIIPMQKKVLPSNKLQDHVYE